MGIKFRCANGHKLHVKSFLAGKKGRCPKCGVKIRVPKEGVSAAQQVGFDLTTARPSEPEDTEFDSNEFPGNVPGLMGADPASIGTVAAAMTRGEPLLDPLAVWYVHLPTGQQLGPAGGREVQGWLQQGGVSPSALVWRDGWAEWRPVSQVFTEQQAFSQPAAIPQAATVRASAIAAPYSPSPQELEARSQLAVPSASMFKPRGRRRVPVGTIFVLMGLVVVLFGISVYVFVIRSL